MYSEKIRILESKLSTLDMRIENHVKTPDYDISILRDLRNQKQNILDELRLLHRLDYEENYERVRFDDDR